MFSTEKSHSAKKELCARLTFSFKPKTLMKPRGTFPLHDTFSRKAAPNSKHQKPFFKKIYFCFFPETVIVPKTQYETLQFRKKLFLSQKCLKMIGVPFDQMKCLR